MSTSPDLEKSYLLARDEKDRASMEVVCEHALEYLATRNPHFSEDTISDWGLQIRINWEKRDEGKKLWKADTYEWFVKRLNKAASNDRISKHRKEGLHERNIVDPARRAHDQKKKNPSPSDGHDNGGSDVGKKEREAMVRPCLEEMVAKGLLTKLQMDVYWDSKYAGLKGEVVAKKHGLRDQGAVHDMCWRVQPRIMDFVKKNMGFTTGGGTA